MTRASGVGAAAAVILLGACGGGSDGGGGGCTPGPSATMTLTSAGVSPKAVCITPGGRVTIANSDTTPHDIAPDAGCPELNLGTIAPSSSKSAILANEEVCAFHDAGDPTNAAFQGTVAVSSGAVQGPGY